MPKRLVDCVEDVKRQGKPTSSAWPICIASTGLKPHKKSEDSVDKAMGEGARGGKIIGHTQSGKPIYAASGNRNHKMFGKQDHEDAAVTHRDLMDSKAHEGMRLGNPDGTISMKDMKRKEQLTKQIKEHRNHRDVHDSKHEGLDKSGDKMKDIFKSMGVTVGSPQNLNLIQKSDYSGYTTHPTHSGVDSAKLGRPGNARDQLFLGIQKGGYSPWAQNYGAENLKNTHAENWHPDADKTLLQGNMAHEVPQHEYGEHPRMARMYDRKMKKLAEINMEPVRKSTELTQEELFLKAEDCLNELTKGDLGSQNIREHHRHLGRHPGGRKQAIAIGLEQERQGVRTRKAVEGGGLLTLGLKKKSKLNRAFAHGYFGSESKKACPSPPFKKERLNKKQRTFLTGAHENSDMVRSDALTEAFDFITKGAFKEMAIEAEDKKRAGEGSRGGNIIGHTTSGKPEAA